MTYKFLLPAATFLLLGLGGCTQIGLGQPNDVIPVSDTAAQPADATGALEADTVLTAAPPPPAAAKTQEALDTTTSAQRAEAAAPAPAAQAETLLGTTVASLGSPAEPGFWLKTPLVKVQSSGRVTNKANGKTSAVTLIPIEGPETGGSRLSLPAMRLIEAPLTELIELNVTLG